MSDLRIELLFDSCRPAGHPGPFLRHLIVPNGIFTKLELLNTLQGAEEYYTLEKIYCCARSLRQA